MLPAPAHPTAGQKVYQQILKSVTLDYRLFSQTLSLAGGSFRNTNAFFGQLLSLMVSWTSSEDPQGAINQGLTIQASQMSTAAASARFWPVHVTSN